MNIQNPDEGGDPNEGGQGDQVAQQQDLEKGHYYADYDPFDLWVHSGLSRYWTAT